MTKRVLILGGYGGFGARLSRRLASDGWDVIVAGRSLAKGEAFAQGLLGSRAVWADRNQGVDAVLQAVQPTLLVDAAGPFQGSGFGVIESCIANGVHYLDLADAREFVCAVDRFDAAAQAARVTVISGASSVPALSGAVVRELSAGMEYVTAIEIAISASDRATAGASVAEAILSYAGKPISLWTGTGWRTALGWTGAKAERFALPGVKPLKRLVALVDIPDLALLPQRVAGHPAVTFRAGPEYAFQARGIMLLGKLVSWGWIKSLRGWSRWLLPLQRLTSFLCSDRSAMVVILSGVADGTAVRRHWVLIAENGDGPEVPVLAAQLFARRLASGELSNGARDAGTELGIAAFDDLFAKLAIQTGTTTT